MKKTSLAKYLNTSESVVFLCATVFVIFFLLWGINTLLIFALISYTLAFTIMALESIFNISVLKDIIKPKKVEEEPQPEQVESQENSENSVTEEETEVVSPEQIKAAKKGIVWQWFRLVFSVLIAAFSLVVLIIY